jgi:hypothetical protein
MPDPAVLPPNVSLVPAQITRESKLTGCFMAVELVVPLVTTVNEVCPMGVRGWWPVTWRMAQCPCWAPPLSVSVIASDPGESPHCAIWTDRLLPDHDESNSLVQVRPSPVTVDVRFEATTDQMATTSDPLAGDTDADAYDDRLALLRPPSRVVAEIAIVQSRRTWSATQMSVVAA